MTYIQKDLMRKSIEEFDKDESELFLYIGQSENQLIFSTKVTQELFHIG